MNQNAGVDCSNSVNISGLTDLRCSSATSMPEEGEDFLTVRSNHEAVGWITKSTFKWQTSDSCWWSSAPLVASLHFKLEFANWLGLKKRRTFNRLLPHNSSRSRRRRVCLQPRRVQPEGSRRGVPGVATRFLS